MDVRDAKERVKEIEKRKREFEETLNHNSAEILKKEKASERGSKNSVNVTKISDNEAQEVASTASVSVCLSVCLSL